jgi:hypothetical protein
MPVPGEKFRLGVFVPKCPPLNVTVVVVPACQVLGLMLVMTGV